ncbi:GNAT family N-acetyltransferase [Halomonadaceae bacterium KBTZ08]
MELRAARESDLAVVLEWIEGEAACRMWAGPTIRYPATPETAWADMGASERNAYVLVGAAGNVVGFGQVLPKNDKTLHLARLIVDPAARGQGIGRALCMALMVIGAANHGAECLTLNVYESNSKAVRLYQGLGFAVEKRDVSGALAMVKPLATASA